MAFIVFFTIRRHRKLLLKLNHTSPFPSASNISITRCTRGFCCSSGNDINSSMLNAPELSKSNFRNLFPSLRISSASTEKQKPSQYHKNNS